MAKYIYPAVFTKEDSGLFSVIFPDFDTCFTQGDDVANGMYMANDVLSITLCDMEDNNQKAPSPSDPLKIKIDKNSFITLVVADTIEYRKTYNTKAVKKTLSIPEWLNTEAERAGVNFSQILQQGLREYLQNK